MMVRMEIIIWKVSSDEQRNGVNSVEALVIHLASISIRGGHPMKTLVLKGNYGWGESKHQGVGPYYPHASAPQ